MTWFTVLKDSKRPGRPSRAYPIKWNSKERLSEIKVWLLEIFNVPLEELDKLNYPHDLVARLRKKSNLEVIDEHHFTLLIMLSEKGRYQELLDVLDNLLKTAAKNRAKESRMKRYKEIKSDPVKYARHRQANKEATKRHRDKKRNKE